MLKKGSSLKTSIKVLSIDKPILTHKNNTTSTQFTHKITMKPKETKVFPNCVTKTRSL